MTHIRMPDFIDYVLTNVTSRTTLVKGLKSGHPEVPSFYAPVSDAIVDMHQKALDGERLDGEPLDNLLDRRTDERERRIFPKVVRGYQRFLREKAHPTTKAAPRWFEPPMRDLPLGPITVRVLPELGLVVDGRPHAIKLYFRIDPLSPQRMMVTNRLMELAFATTWPGMVFSVLDVRRGRLYSGKGRPEIADLLRAEALSLGSLWSAL